MTDIEKEMMKDPKLVNYIKCGGLYKKVAVEAFTKGYNAAHENNKVSAKQAKQGGGKSGEKTE